MKDTLKVKDLIAILKTVNSNLQVILQKDPKGNEYAPVSFFDTGKYKFIKSTTKRANPVGLGVLIPNFKKYGPGEDVLIPNY